jgi:hypothetical protein
MQLKWSLKYLGVVGMIICLVFTTGMALADNVNVGNLISLQLQTPQGGNSGGEFVATVYDNTGKNVLDSFITFCVERDETFGTGTKYYVADVSTKVIQGGLDSNSSPSLSYGAAYLYRKFRDGTLYTNTNQLYNTTLNQTDLQLAIWALEGEWSPASLAVGGNAKYWYELAKDTAVNLSSYWGVLVINPLGYSNGQPMAGDYHQSWLTVPEPSTLLLLGAALTVIALRQRKRKTA